MKKSIQLLAKFCAIACLSIVFSSIALAQVSITTPAAAGESTAFARDYAYEVLQDPWDMNQLDDLAQHLITSDYGSGLNDFTDWTFTNDIFGFEIETVDNAFFHMLSPGLSGFSQIAKTGQRLPIDSTLYRFLNIRMKTDEASTLRIHWNTGENYSTNFVRTTTINTMVGWNVYTIDLDTIGVSSTSNESRGWSEAQQITGLRIEPGASGNVEIDWMTLTNTPPSDVSVSHSFLSAGNDTLYSLFVDDDTDPFDGHFQEVVSAASSTTTANVEVGKLFPGSYNILGVASDDFATLHANPWDMNEIFDVIGSSGVTGLGVSGGNLTGTTSSTAPSVTLNNFGGTIPASTFNRFSMNLNVGSAGSGRIVWFNEANLSGSVSFALASGDNLIQTDLSLEGSWTGNITTFTVEIHNQASVAFTLDFVSLRNSSFVSSLTNPTAVVSPGQLTVNAPPIFEFLQPDRRGGEDYASAVLGNPWNMNSIDDIARVDKLTTALIYPNNFLNGRQGDFFCGVNEEGEGGNGGGDPIQYSLEVSKRADERIDADRYKNVTLEAFIDSVQDVFAGSSTRIIGRNLLRDGKFFSGDDTLNQSGGNGRDFFTLHQDMTALPLEDLLHPPGDLPDPFWTGLFDTFRVDVHEFSDPTMYCIDSIELRADDESDTQFAITFRVTDTNTDPENLSVSFFFTTGTTAENGTAIVENLSLDRDSRIVLWDTTNVPNGTYRIYATVTDGLNSHTVISHRVVVDHTRSQDTTAPTLVVDTPTDGGEFFENIRVIGYAIDNHQVADVQVLVDGEFAGQIQPSLFDKRARSAFPTLADASRSGFRTEFDISQLSFGSHTAEIRAYDTAGNVTSQTFSFTRSSGSDPAFPTAPVENEATEEVPLSGATRLRLRVKLNKRRGVLKLIVNNADRCSSLDIYGSLSRSALISDFSATTNLESVASVSKRKLTFQAKGLKALRRNEEEGITGIFVAMVCDGEFKTVKKVDVTKIATFRKLRNAERYLQKLVRRLKLKGKKKNR